MRFEDLGSQDGRKLPRRRINGIGVQKRLPEFVHLDPDIRADLRPRSASRRGKDIFLFGQCDQAQSHLANRGVSVGDLFLFFGLFQEAEDDSECLRFVRGAHKKHILWGWLEVGEDHDLQCKTPRPDLAAVTHHPHLQYIGRKNNHVYRASKQLSFSPYLAGAGIFERYNDALCLSRLGQPLCSQWALPKFLRQTKASFLHLEAWQAEAEFIVGRAPGRGQEFVMDTAGVETQVERWLKSLFKHAKGVQ